MADKKFRIFRTEPEGGDVFCVEKSNLREAKKEAKRKFSQKSWLGAEFFIEKVEEVSRLRADKIGFRKKE